MANTKTGFDSAWDWPSHAALTAWVKAAGPNPVVSGYLGPDTTKNWTPARLREVHGLHAGAEMNFEWYANRALEGYSAGLADGKLARQQIVALARAVGYAAGSRLIVTFSVDFDTNPGQYPTIDAYLKGCEAGLAGLADAGDYGEYDLIMHTAKVGTSHAEWQTYAWSGGRFAAGVADFYQWQNSMKLGGASVDYDQVIDAAKLGAWWPPNHPLNEGADMPLTDQDIARIWAYRLAGDPDAHGKKPVHNASTWLIYAAERAQASIDAAAANGHKLDSALQILGQGASSVLQRVASLQSAVAGMAKAAAAPVELDTAAVVAGVKAEIAGVADQVVAKVKSLSWKVGD